MAKCDICEKDMLKVKGCLHRDYVIDGKRIEAIEHRDRYVLTFDDDARCGDCNALEGEPHHLGCDMEECPGCGGQMISCDCDISDSIFVFPKGRVKK